MTSRPLHFFVPFKFSKADPAQRMVWGYASTEAQDADGETIEKTAIEGALDEYMKFANLREMHQLKAAGVVREATVDAKGLYIGAKVVDKDAWEKVVEGVYKGFSIGGEVVSKVGNAIKSITLNEISLVDRPANPEALIEVFKAMKPTQPELELDKAKNAESKDEPKEKPKEEPAEKEEPKGEEPKKDEGGDAPAEKPKEGEPEKKEEAEPAKEVSHRIDHKHEHEHKTEAGEAYTHDHRHIHEVDGEGEGVHAHPHGDRGPVKVEAKEGEEKVEECAEEKKAALEPGYTPVSPRALKSLADLAKAEGASVEEVAAAEAAAPLDPWQVMWGINLIAETANALCHLYSVTVNAKAEDMAEGEASEAGAMLEQAVEVLANALIALTEAEAEELLATFRAEGGAATDLSEEQMEAISKEAALKAVKSLIAKATGAKSEPEAPAPKTDLSKSIEAQGLLLKELTEAVTTLASRVPGASKGVLKAIGKADDIGPDAGEEAPKNAVEVIRQQFVKAHS